MKTTKPEAESIGKSTIYTTIAVNLVPIFGIIFLKWSLFSILIFYWLESAVIGFFNVLKMAIAKVQTNEESYALVNGKPTTINLYLIMILIKIFLIAFFCIHFGSFMFGHLFAILFIAGTGGVEINFSLILYSVLIPAVSLFISHGYSFYANYIQKKEYLLLNVKELMFAPYRRVILMHLIIILGGFFIYALNAPEILAVIFIIAKTFVDVSAHKREHVLYLYFDFSKQWSAMVDIEKKKLGVKKLDNKTLKELYERIEKSRYGN
jgi:hypothetical protein